jgi:hypothetical protein
MQFTELWSQRELLFLIDESFPDLALQFTLFIKLCLSVCLKPLNSGCSLALASLAEMPLLAFSLSAQRRLVLARISIHSTSFALHPLAGAMCEFISKMKCSYIEVLNYDFVAELISLVGIISAPVKNKGRHDFVGYYNNFEEWDDSRRRRRGRLRM